jgi:hypothetical protein
VKEGDPMSKLSILADTLRSNGAWKRSVRDSNPKDRWKYWALRLGLAILVIFVMYLFNIHQHQELR